MPYKKNYYPGFVWDNFIKKIYLPGFVWNNSIKKIFLATIKNFLRNYKKISSQL